MLPGVTVWFQLGFTAPAALSMQPFTVPNGSMGAQRHSAGQFFRERIKRAQQWAFHDRVILGVIQAQISKRLGGSGT